MFTKSKLSEYFKATFFLTSKLGHIRNGVNVVYARYLLYLILACYNDCSSPFIAQSQSMFMALVGGDALSCWKDKHTEGSLALFVITSVATIMSAIIAVVHLFGKC